MAKSIVFDTGPIISLAMNSLLWILEPLKKSFGGSLCIPAGVRKELIDRPLQSKKFKFEALRVLSYVNKNVLVVVENEKIIAKTKYLNDIANRIFMARGSYIQIVHYGEMEALATTILMDSSAMVVDERTTRMLIENPKGLQNIMEKKLHTKLQLNRKNLDEFARETKNVRLIRSTELAVVAYRLGLLDKYLPQMENPEKQLLESVLWGIKLSGCSISQREIDTAVKIEVKGRR